MHWLEQFIPRSGFELILNILLLVGTIFIVAGVVLLIKRGQLIAASKRTKLLSVITIVIAGLAIIPTGGLAYVYLIEPNLLHIATYEYDVEQLELTEPIRIAAIGDLQHKGIATPSYVYHVANIVNTTNPDIVIWVGDLLSKDATELGAYGDAFASIEANHAKYAVMGNHDYRIFPRWWAPDLEVGEQVVDFWEQNGFTVLRNDAEQLVVSSTILGIAGNDSSWYQLLDQDQTNSKATEFEADFNLLITHEPDDLLLADPAIYDLAVAGHCHGGQVNIGTFNSLIGAPHVPIGCLEIQQSPWGLNRINDIDIFTTTGIGTANPRFRFMVPPEVMVIDIF